MDYRQLARGLAAARIAVGVAGLAAPGRFGAPWIGPLSSERSVKITLRAMGARDVALGVATMQALDTDADARPLVRLSAAADTADVLASVLAIRAIGLRRMVFIAAIAGTAALAGFAAADQLD